jgi:signal transduction histidine kinase
VGLASALVDVAAPLRAAGIEVDLDIDDDARLGLNAEALVFRVVEEGLRNAHAHGAPRHVGVRLRRENGRVHLAVVDDGRGFSPQLIAERQAAGHRGLALLEDLAAEAGGRLEVHSGPGSGTTLELDSPAA